jgi:hypothetical protein
MKQIQTLWQKDIPLLPGVKAKIALAAAKEQDTLWSLKIKSDKRIYKTNVKQTVSLFEQAHSLFYVLSDYLIKNHKRDGSVWARNLIYQPGVSDAPLVKEKEPG